MSGCRIKRYLPKSSKGSGMEEVCGGLIALRYYKDKELIRIGWVGTSTRSCCFPRRAELLPTGHCGYKQCIWIRNLLDTFLEDVIHQRLSNIQTLITHLGSCRSTYHCRLEEYSEEVSPCICLFLIVFSRHLLSITASDGVLD